MPFEYKTSFPIDIGYNAIPDRLFVHVVAGANVRIQGRRLEFKDAGGRVVKGACGSDYTFTDGRVWAKVDQYGDGHTLDLCLRENPANGNHWRCRVDLSAGTWAVETSAGGSAGSGSVGETAIQVGDVLELSCTASASAPAFTLRRNGVQVGTANGFGFSASGRAGVGVNGEVGMLCRLSEFGCGPLNPAARGLPWAGGRRRTNFYAMITTLVGGNPDSQAQVWDELWNPGQGWPWFKTTFLDSDYARGYRAAWVRGPGGNNSTGVRIGANHLDQVGASNLHFLRLNDYLLDAARAGMGTVAADGRLLDNFLTTWKAIVDQWHLAPGGGGEIVAYGCTPPIGNGVGVAWPTDDAALEEWTREMRQLGMPIGLDAWAFIAPSRPLSDVAARYVDYLLRTRLPGETYEGEAHLDTHASHDGQAKPPHLAGSLRVGPMDRWMSLGNTDGSSIWEQMLANPLGYWGPGRTNGRHAVGYQGGGPPTHEERFVACRKALLQGHVVVGWTFGWTAAQDREIVQLGEAMANEQRRADVGRGRPRRGRASRA